MRPGTQGADLDLPVEQIRVIGTANPAFVDNFAGSAGILGFGASNPVDGTTRDCERLAVCLLVFCTPAGGGALQARLGLRTSCLRPPLAGP